MEKRQQKEKALWDKLARHYDRQTRSLEPAYKRTMELSIPFLKPNHYALEIGCGTGIMSFFLAEQVKSLLATDISHKMIHQAERKAAEQKIRNLQFQVSDGYDINAEPQSFDVVLLFNVLYVVKEPESMLLEIRRLLKDGGILLLATDCLKEYHNNSEKLKAGFSKFLNTLGIIPFMHSYSQMEVEELLKQLNFNILKSEIIHPWPANCFIAAQKGSE